MELLHILREVKPLLTIASTTFCFNIVFQIHKLHQRSKTDKLDINRIMFQLIFSFLVLASSLLYIGDNINSEDNILLIVIIAIHILATLLNIILLIMFYIYQPNKNKQKPHVLVIIVSLSLLTGVLVVLFVLSDNNNYDTYLCPFICACSVYAIKLVSQLKMNMIHVSTFAISNVSVVFGIVTDIVLMLIYVFNWSTIQHTLRDTLVSNVILKVVSILCLAFHLIEELLLVFQYYCLYYERRSDTLKIQEHLFIIDLE